MSIFKKNRINRSNVVEEHFVPAMLPVYGLALNTFVIGNYSLSDPDVRDAHFMEISSGVEGVLATCDIHSDGTECDHYIDGEMQRLYAIHQGEVADHEAQAQRIRSARETQKEWLTKEIFEMEEKSEELKKEIAPLKGLRTQFRFKIGRVAVSLGLVVTLLCLVVDSFVNYSFLQDILLTNKTFLWITVVCLGVASDVTMWLLGTYISKKEEGFVSKPLYRTVCSVLLGFFLLSVAATVAIRFGSMDSTFGTINADGEFVGKEVYNIAEYGITLLTSFVTACTGALSFFCSLDKNAAAVARREKMELDLKKNDALLAVKKAEFSELEKAADPIARDMAKRPAIEATLEAMRDNLKLACRKSNTVRLKDPSFTEKMAISGKKILHSPSEVPHLSSISLAQNHLTAAC